MNYLKNDRWDDDDPDDDQQDDNDAYGDGADESTMACPFCGEEIYDDAERCPECGNYISWTDTDGDGDRPAQAQLTKRPLWIIVTAVLLIYAMLHAYLWPIIALWLWG